MMLGMRNDNGMIKFAPHSLQVYSSLQKSIWIVL